jgi:hypothetical protein
LLFDQWLACRRLPDLLGSYQFGLLGYIVSMTLLLAKLETILI